MNWEYAKITVTHDHQDLEKVLNDLGKDRWELVASGSVQSNFSDSDSVLLLFFKRPIPEPPEITARKKASLEILRDETITDPGERLDRAFAAALGETKPATEQPGNFKLSDITPQGKEDEIYDASRFEKGWPKD